jgi:hypothetical protein
LIADCQFPIADLPETKSAKRQLSPGDISVTE